MTLENKVGIFGNGQLIESVRNVLNTPLNFFDYETKGQEHLELAKTTPTILCFFPHTSHLDPLSIRYTSPKDVRKLEVFPAANDYWYQSKLKAVMSSLLLNTVPMERHNAARILDSLKIARGVLDQGYTLVFSPEGTRSLISLEDRQLHRGPIDLALRGGYPIIPVRLRGFEDIMPKGHAPRLLNGVNRWQVSVNFGEPIPVPKLDKTSKRLREGRNLTSYLKNKFLEM